MKRIRALVVEDSATIRRYLVGVLAASSEFEVVGEAENGQQAIRLCESLRPDVVTMDIMLPVMTGVAATEYIMAWCPTPIAIVSASVNRGEALQTYDALAAGAVDVVEKPTATESREQWEKTFLSRVRTVSRIKVITHPRGRLNGNSSGAPRPLLARGQVQPAGAPFAVKPIPGTSLPANWPDASVRCIAIGASTGGPAAVADILKVLPADFPIPLLLVIHVSDQFAFALAEWLSTQSRLPVRFAQDGESLPQVGNPGVLLAPAGRHLIISGQSIRLVNRPERHSCRPSVDELFESVAVQMRPNAACVLLTGMGRDGASGLLRAREAGCLTIAQDEETSVVFGMPGEAIKLGAAALTLPLQQIAPMLITLSSHIQLKGGYV
ncbi:MAG TPA: chemotaxis-specific protein-glutamate methyltransferase CheB [Terracidiphilus sp.]